MEAHSGLVIQSVSGFFTVRTDAAGDYVCTIPNRLKYAIRQQQKTQDQKYTDIVAAGDVVQFKIEDEAKKIGLITSVMPRKSALSRSRPAPRQRNQALDREQVLVANPDQAVFVFSIKKPEPNLRKLDRFLVIAEMNKLPSIICVNKIDLATVEAGEGLFRAYISLGYPVVFTSAHDGTGIDALRELLVGKLSVLTGSSGVGKSSLLNAIQPQLGRKVAEVSQATDKGKHTTRHVELIPLEGGGYLADTPGIRGIALYDLEPDELDGYFREIAPLVADCEFSDCAHQHEPNCAVRAAVERGDVTAERYDSYLRLREEHTALQASLY